MQNWSAYLRPVGVKVAQTIVIAYATGCVIFDCPSIGLSKWQQHRYYNFVNGNYEGLTQYASFKGFETMRVNYKLTIEDGKLHTVGTVGGSTTIYNEVYVRED